MRFVYDFRNAGEPFIDPNFGHAYSDADSAFVLWIERTEYSDTKFGRHYPAWDIHHIDGHVAANLDGLFQLYPAPERTRKGVVIEYPETCGGGGGVFDTRDYDTAVRVPVRPERGERYHYYECGDIPEATFEVTATNQKVTVPAGTFEEVFVLYNAAAHEKEYWSEQEGLVKIEVFHEDGSSLGTYALASRSF